MKDTESLKFVIQLGYEVKESNCFWAQNYSTELFLLREKCWTRKIKCIPQLFCLPDIGPAFASPSWKSRRVPVLHTHRGWLHGGVGAQLCGWVPSLRSQIPLCGHQVARRHQRAGQSEHWVPTPASGIVVCDVSSGATGWGKSPSSSQLGVGPLWQDSACAGSPESWPYYSQYLKSRFHCQLPEQTLLQKPDVFFSILLELQGKTNFPQDFYCKKVMRFLYTMPGSQ